MRSFRRRVLAFAPLLVLASCAIRPSTVPLGGTDAPAPPPKRSTQTGADRVDDAAEASPDRDAADQHEPVPGTSATTTGSSDETETPRDPGAIYFNPIPFKKGTVCEQNQHVEMEMLMSPPGGIASGQIPVSASQEQKARITVTKMDGTNIAKARVEFLDVAEEMTIEMGILGKKSDRRKGDTDGRTFDVDWSSSSG